MPRSLLARDALAAVREMRGHALRGLSYEEVRAGWMGSRRRAQRLGRVSIENELRTGYSCAGGRCHQSSFEQPFRTRCQARGCSAEPDAGLDYVPRWDYKPNFGCDIEVVKLDAQLGCMLGEDAAAARLAGTYNASDPCTLWECECAYRDTRVTEVSECNFRVDCSYQCNCESSSICMPTGEPIA